MSWLDAQLQAYIATQVARMAGALAPAALAIAAVYVMGWGYLHLRGVIAEPLVEGVRRIVTLGIVLGVAIHLWLYQSVVVTVFFDGPAQLSAALIGAGDPVGTVDAIWEKGGAVGEVLWNRGGVLNGEVGYYAAGAAVWALVGLLCVYTVFLLALARIAGAVLLALGPLFILSLLAERTRHFFESWVAQLVNYGLIGVLMTLVASLLLQLLASYADQTAARGGDLLTVDVLNLLLATGLILLLLRQILPIAAGLSRGIALSTMGTVGNAVSLGMRPVRSALSLAASPLRSPLPDPVEHAMAQNYDGAPGSVQRVTPVWRRPPQ